MRSKGLRDIFDEPAQHSVGSSFLVVRRPFFFHMDCGVAVLVFPEHRGLRGTEARNADNYVQGGSDRLRRWKALAQTTTEAILRCSRRHAQQEQDKISLY